MILRKGVFTSSETAAQVGSLLHGRRVPAGPTQHLVRRAVAFIEQNHASHLTREDIARHVAISPDYLRTGSARRSG